jgi:bifunctional non-homologous end joining protein LigD
MAKNQRNGRIFLDTCGTTARRLRSRRARPGATIAMPLRWNQVKTDLGPTHFTIRTVPVLLEKTTAWEDYCDGQRSLEQAIKRKRDFPGTF